VARSRPPLPGFLRRTGQRWRYELPAAAFIACGVGLMVGGGRRSPLLLGLALFNFVLMCVWARCPRCGSAVVWRVFTRARVWKWMTAVLELRQCPACSFEGSGTNSTGSGGATT
jgi:hypothetical protein